jgi:hypothetical protein
MASTIRFFCVLGLLALLPLAHLGAEGARQVTSPPQELKLSGFYKKYVAVRKLPVVASVKVSDYALLEAAYLIEQMLAKRPDIIDALAKNNVRFASGAQRSHPKEILGPAGTRPGIDPHPAGGQLRGGESLGIPG